MTPPPLSPEHMRLIDSLYADPEARAEAVYNLLLNTISDKPEQGQLGLAFWDVLCFSVHFIGLAAEGFADDGLIRVAKAANFWMYTAHYNDVQSFLPTPDLLTWRVKYGLQSEPPSGPEDGTVPEGASESSDNHVIPIERARRTGPPPEGSN